MHCSWEGRLGGGRGADSVTYTVVRNVRVPLNRQAVRVRPLGSHFLCSVMCVWIRAANSCHATIRLNHNYWQAAWEIRFSKSVDSVIVALG